MAGAETAQTANITLTDDQFAKMIAFTKPKGESKAEQSAKLKKDISDAVDGWIAEHHIKTVLPSERIYRYDKSGVYRPDGEGLIAHLMEERFKGVCTIHHVKEAIGMVKRRTEFKLEPSDYKSDIINVKNGLLNLETRELIPHTPDHWSVSQIPVIYDPQADCPNIKKFFSEIVHPRDIPLLCEIVGWTLHWWEYKPHKAVMLYGKGRNGKGTFLRLLEAFLGMDNVSHVGLQTLVSNKYAPSDLIDKAANLYGDLPQRDLSETDIFKGATGEDAFRTEDKFQKSFDYRNWAKMLFGANQLPKSPDDTDGFYSRWIIVEFPFLYGPTGRPMNPNLDKELRTPEELSGLLNIAIDALARLKANNWEFSYNLTIEDVRNMYKRLADPVFAFIQDCCEPSDGATPKKGLYEAYREYAKKSKLPPVTLTKFVKNMEDQYYIPVDACRVGPQGEQVKSWCGIKLKCSSPKKLEDSADSTLFSISNFSFEKEISIEEKEVEKKRDMCTTGKSIFEHPELGTYEVSADLN